MQGYEYFRPLTSGWLGKLEAAERARKKWKEVAAECQMFYSRSAAAMWDPSYSRKFWTGIPSPKFRITINKAFELVAIFGPTLFYDTPYRLAVPKRPLEIDPVLFGDVQNDPNAQQMFQMAQQEHAMEYAKDKAIAALSMAWLNYTPREQPGGGLESHGELAVIDALVKGRGCLWAKPYRMPGSGRTLTGCFREPPENLLIDPDFNSVEEAKWIAKRCVHPTWEVERKYRLPTGSLKGKATLESSWSGGARVTDDWASMHRATGRTNDLMVYYEIYSKTGCGARLTGMDMAIKDHLEATVGDYAYIVVAPNVPYPLNCPSAELQTGATSDDVRRMFQWPIPYWSDDKFPVDILDFYPDTESAWPIAPLGPALGELKFLNVMMPYLCNRIWSSSRDFIAVAQSAVSDLRKHLEEGADQTIIPITDAMGGIDKCIAFLQQPQTNLDVWRIIEAVSTLFDKRTGLSDYHYAANPEGTQNRTAEESANKRNAAGVRPQYMQKKVARWQSQAAASEAFCMQWFVNGEDVEPLLGRTGRMLWERIIMSDPQAPERVVRQMNYSIAASSIRRPDKDRDIANVNQALQIFGQMANEHANVTGDTKPINALIKTWGEASDMNVDDIMFGQRTPMPPPPEVQQQMQAQQQAEQAKLQADLQGKQVDAQSKMAQAQAAQEKVRLELAAKQQEMAMEREARQEELLFGREKFMQELHQDRVLFGQDIAIKQATSQQKIKEQKEMGKAKVELAKKQAAAKPKANGSKAGSKK